MLAHLGLGAVIRPWFMTFHERRQPCPSNSRGRTSCGDPPTALVPELTPARHQHGCPAHGEDRPEGRDGRRKGAGTQGASGEVKDMSLEGFQPIRYLRCASNALGLGHVSEVSGPFRAIVQCAHGARGADARALPGPRGCGSEVGDAQEAAAHSWPQRCGGAAAAGQAAAGGRGERASREALEALQAPRHGL